MYNSNVRDKNLLPATIPVDYWSDLFIAIHADGNLDSRVSGFKVAGPRRDFTDQSEELADTLETEYQAATKMQLDENITSNMRGYYAFSWWRYEHAIHPMTISAVFETGFLTSYKDQAILIYNPKKAAQGIADGVVKFISLQ